MPRVLGGGSGGGRFLVSEVPLYPPRGGPAVSFRPEAGLLWLGGARQGSEGTRWSHWLGIGAIGLALEPLAVLQEGEREACHQRRPRKTRTPPASCSRGDDLICKHF